MFRVSLVVLGVFTLVACFMASEAALYAQTTAPSPVEQSQPTTPNPAGSAVNRPEKNEIKPYTLPPDKLAKALAYSRQENLLYFIEIAYGIAVLLLLILVRYASRLRQFVERKSQRSIVQAFIFAPLFLLTVDLLSLPLGIYSHWLQVSYDLSVQRWGGWFGDWAKSELINIAISAFLIWLFYLVIRHSPRRWWFYGWVGALPLILLGLFAQPLLIDPLFNKFEPLAEKAPTLVTEIEKVVQRGGLEIPRDRMFEMDASTRTKTMNAYVSGFGASKRVVVWDTTIANMNTSEILFVFGHEMGHYVLGHIWKLFAFTAALLLVLLGLIYLAANWAIRRWSERWDIRGLGDWASLPVLLLALSVFGFFAQPIFNTYDRGIEHEADVYGLEVIHGIVPNPAQSAAQAFQKLGEGSLSDPNPPELIKIWLYSHPPIGERVLFVQEYDPWSKGESPRFVK